MVPSHRACGSAAGDPALMHLIGPVLTNQRAGALRPVYRRAFSKD
jgi:hypothetical protein